MKLFLHYTLLIPLLFAVHSVGASELKDDESVMLFTTQARFNELDKVWQVPVHGWIFERESDSLWRKATVKSLGKVFGLDDDVDLQQNALFRQRAQYFLVDNEGNKQLSLRVADQTIRSDKSGANGHFSASTILPIAHFNPARTEHWLPITVIPPPQDARQFTSNIQLMHATGTSVISDVDDTIKISNVLDKKELMHNTFVREFEAVPGMSTLYHYWHTQGADFHYVSASPWQLYPALTGFLQRAGYPHGSFHMKQFRVKDESFHNLFISPLEYKVPLISELILAYPQRQFILVGDSGEKDPEVYAEILRRFPAQIKKIYIRNVTGEPGSHQRYLAIYPAGAKELLHVFDDVNEILKDKI